MAGHSTGSIDLLFNLLRLGNSYNITKSSDGFGLSDNFRSRYARLIMEKESGLKGFFSIKDLTTATVTKVTTVTTLVDDEDDEDGFGDYDDVDDDFFDSPKPAPEPVKPTVTWYN